MIGGKAVLRRSSWSGARQDSGAANREASLFGSWLAGLGLFSLHAVASFGTNLVPYTLPPDYPRLLACHDPPIRRLQRRCTLRQSADEPMQQFEQAFEIAFPQFGGKQLFVPAYQPLGLAEQALARRS